MAMKRGQFIGKGNSILQEMSNANSYLRMKIIESFAHGSSLWARKSKDAERIYKIWNLTLRNIFCLARTIYRGLINHCTSCCPYQISLISIDIKFVHTLMERRKFSVRYLARIMAENENLSMGRLLTLIGGKLKLAISQINKVSPKVIKGHQIF